MSLAKKREWARHIARLEDTLVKYRSQSGNPDIEKEPGAWADKNKEQMVRSKQWAKPHRIYM